MFKGLSDIVGGSPHSNLPSFEVQWPEVFYGGKILLNITTLSGLVAIDIVEIMF